MPPIFRKPEIIVLLAWGITFAVGILGEFVWNWVVTKEAILTLFPYATTPYFVSLMIVLASISTALALGLKNLLLAILLALPCGVFMFAVLLVLPYNYGVLLDAKPVEMSLLFFLFSVIGGPLLIPRCKDDNLRNKIYQGALLLIVLLTATTFLLLYLDMLPLTQENIIVPLDTRSL